MRLAKLISLSAVAVAVIVAALVVPPAARYVQKMAFPTATVSAAIPPQNSETKKPANPFAARSEKAAGSSRALMVTVLDARTGQPIKGAKLSPYVNGQNVPAFEDGFKTGPDGTAKLPIPVNLPGGERANYCEIPVAAPGYAERVIRWSCSTGMVLNIVSSEHTVELSSGISLSGVVVDETGKPLAGQRIGANGFGLVGGSEVVHQEDYSSFWMDVKNSSILTDGAGRFTIEQFPSDVRALELSILGPENDLHKFQTPEGFMVHAEVLPKVSLAELKQGTARIVIPRGVTVQGLVVDKNGAPVEGAEVLEATENGNLRILSSNKTDSSGHFRLSHRPPREIILAAAAEGCASVSAIVSVRPDMEPVRLELSGQMPLCGQVVNEAGLPVPFAKVSFNDFINPGLCFEWADETGTDGRFEWTEAPTNEVALSITATGYATRVARLRGSTNETLVTLRAGNNDSIHITGQATDADSGAPIDHFRIKVYHEMMVGNIPEGQFQQFEGSQGGMDVKLLHKDFPIGMGEIWIMTLEAEGYDTVVSRPYDLAEGDQQLDFKLRRGGMVKGTVRTPSGKAAAGAKLAFEVFGQILSTKPGELSGGHLTNRTDADGRLSLVKPSLASNLVVFHDAGWAVVPITPGPMKTNITLSPWGQISGTLIIGQQPAGGRDIRLELTRANFLNPLAIFYSAKTDDAGNFSFDKMPSGNFKISCREGRWDIGTLETYVDLRAGESKTVQMTSNGRAVTAQIEIAPGLGAVNWSNVSATLKAAVAIPPEPAQSDFVNYEGMAAVKYRYNHDPAVLAAYALQRTFAGTLHSDGTATFQDVPPGHYTLEVKLFDPDKRPPPPIWTMNRRSFSPTLTLPSPSQTTPAHPTLTASPCWAISRWRRNQNLHSGKPDAVVAGRVVGPVGIREIDKAIGQRHGLQRHPDRVGQIRAGLHHDGNVGRAGDVEAELAVADTCALQSRVP